MADRKRIMGKDARMKRALITGQDGPYLAELLLSKGYEVHGIIRRASTFNTERIDHIYQDPSQPSTRLFLQDGNLSSTEWILNLVYSFTPDKLYHLAGQSHEPSRGRLRSTEKHGKRFWENRRVVLSGAIASSGPLR